MSGGPGSPTLDAVTVHEARILLAGKGYAVVPVVTRDKAVHATGWQQTRPGAVPAFRADWANTGVLCRGLRVPDVDIDDAPFAARVSAAVEQHFGESPVHRGRGDSPRRVTFYRAERGEPTKIVVEFPGMPRNADGKVAKLEILATGQQVVVPPSVHPDGCAYHWCAGPGLDEIEAADLPTVTDEQVRALVEELTGEGFFGVLKGDVNGHAHAAAGPREPATEADVIDAEAALLTLDVTAYATAKGDGGGHGRFIDIARAAWAGGVRFETFVAWCRNHPKFKKGGEGEKWCETEWRSFANTHSITVATLYAEVFARRPGWRKPSDLEAEYRQPGGNGGTPPPPPPDDDPPPGDPPEGDPPPRQGRRKGKRKARSNGGGSGGAGATDGFDRNADGFIIANSQRNVRAAIARLGVSLSHDTFADKLLIADLEGFGPALDDAAVVRLWLVIDETFRFRPTREFFGSVVDDMARRQAFHPLRDYLTDLDWDGTDRLAAWTVTYLGADDTEAHRQFGLRFLIAAVARAMDPGCKADHMLILEGPQGILKSTALCALTGKQWFTDEIHDVGSKDAAMQLAGRWIVELSELDAMGRAEVTKVKGWLTRTVDKYRPPYGRYVIEQPRSCVIAGTSNADHYLKDETGGRRFWPVRCGTIALAAIERDRDQLWAEAVHRWRAGEKWWLTDAAHLAAASMEQEQRREADAWEDRVGKYVEGREAVTTDEILESVLFIDIGKWSQTEQRRVAKALRALGWRVKVMKDAERRSFRQWVPE